MLRWLPVLIALIPVSAPALSAEAVSGPKAQQLTVYNQGFALVKDSRIFTLGKGINSIEVEDVAARIDPTSILFRSLTAPNSLAILEQNYQYDLISPDNILNKSTGQRITFTSFDDQGRPRTQHGVLLAPPANGGVVIKTDDGRIVLRPEGQISLEKMPEGLHPRPTLNWLLDAVQAGEQQTEISYITEGIGWKADYVVLVNRDDTKLDLAGWVTLDNKSGATYKDARLTLMAGDVRKLRPRAEVFDNLSFGVTMSGVRAAGAPQFQEKSFFEYHMYQMDRQTTIRDNETKQLSLLDAADVPVKKLYTFDARGDWFRSWWQPGYAGHPGEGYDTSNYHKVNVVLEVKNSEANHMGMPLPKGRVRVYKLDDDGSQQFVGEDDIDHTPKDEKISLYIGDAFDIVGDYKRTNFRKISDRVVEESFEVKVRNHKKTPVTVSVVDHVWSDWKVTESTLKFDKKDAHTIEFPVKVSPDGETVITYTIRTTW
jgi:hypothetical protein